MLKKVLSLLMTFVLLFSVPFSVSAQNQKKFESAQESLSEEERFLNSLSEPALDIDIENLCNYYNGLEYTVDETIDDVLHCQVVGDSYVQIYYENALKQRASVPEYLERAYNSIFGENQNLSRSGRSSSSNYIISDRGLFKIFYDDVNTSSGTFNMSAVRLMGAIFDAIAGYFSDFEFPTTDGTYYEVYLSSSLTSSGTTTMLGNSLRSNITIDYGLLYNFYEEDDTFVLGVAAHEFTHALAFHYGVYYNTTAAHCFHEGLARAMGIMYDETYSNVEGVCGDISIFITSLGQSYMTNDTPQYRYGTAIFPLFLVQRFDTVDHDTLDVIRYILEEMRIVESLTPNRITSMEKLLTAISNVLTTEFNTTFSGEFKYFMLYNSNPDVAYVYAPRNRIGATARSWGSPNFQGIYTVSQKGQTFTGTGSLPYLACHYYKFELSSSTYHGVTVTMANELDSEDSQCSIGYVYYYSNNGTYFYYSAPWGDYDEWTYTFYLNPLGVTEIYLVFINTGYAGTLSYSIDALTK